jgi:hypothetical protein
VQLIYTCFLSSCILVHYLICIRALLSKFPFTSTRDLTFQCLLFRIFVIFSYSKRRVNKPSNEEEGTPVLWLEQRFLTSWNSVFVFQAARYATPILVHFLHSPAFRYFAVNATLKALLRAVPKAQDEDARTALRDLICIRGDRRIGCQLGHRLS